MVVNVTGTVQRWTGLSGTSSTEKKSVPAAPFGVIGPRVKPHPLTGGSAAPAPGGPAPMVGSDTPSVQAIRASQ